MQQKLIYQIAYWQTKQLNELRGNFNVELYLKVLIEKLKRA